MERVLRDKFGFSTFRPHQKEIVEHALKGKDTFVVMATGAGKSLCYQFPPVFLNKTCLVVSPLISLMDDQVMALTQLNIKACALNSLQFDVDVVNGALQGEFSIVFATPEFVVSRSEALRPLVDNNKLCLIAVDEAHCVSEWGHDFRPDYTRLGALRATFPGVPIMALTATATERVRKEIAVSLGLQDHLEVVTTFNRPNLKYTVTPSDGSLDQIKSLVAASFPAPTIIYCTKRDTTEELSRKLAGALRVQVGCYHAGLDAATRATVHRQFVNDELSVVICTIAFGMGIDKPDVKQVIHVGMPKSIETYYQQSGRAGRDGNPAECVLVYSKQDLGSTQKQATAAMFDAMKMYAVGTKCRRKTILEYFGEELNESCNNCDVCLGEAGSASLRDLTKEALQLLMAVSETGERFGAKVPILILRGSQSKRVVERFGARLLKLKSFGVGRSRSEEWWQALANMLTEAGLLRSVQRQGSQGRYAAVYSITTLSKEGAGFLRQPDAQRKPLSLVVSRDMLDAEVGSAQLGLGALPPGTTSRAFTSREQQLLYHSLLGVRKATAQRHGVAPYMVFSEMTIRAVAFTMPTSLEEFGKLDGVTSHKAASYGNDFVQAVRAFCEAQQQAAAPDAVPGQQSSGPGGLPPPEHSSPSKPSQQPDPRPQPQPQPQSMSQPQPEPLSQLQSQGSQLGRSRTLPGFLAGKQGAGFGVAHLVRESTGKLGGTRRNDSRLEKRLRRFGSGARAGAGATQKGKDGGEQDDPAVLLAKGTSVAELVERRGMARDEVLRGAARAVRRGEDLTWKALCVTREMYDAVAGAVASVGDPITCATVFARLRQQPPEPSVARCLGEPEVEVILAMMERRKAYAPDAFAAEPLPARSASGSEHKGDGFEVLDALFDPVELPRLKRRKTTQASVEVGSSGTHPLPSPPPQHRRQPSRVAVGKLRPLDDVAEEIEEADEEMADDEGKGSAPTEAAEPTKAAVFAFIKATGGGGGVSWLQLREEFAGASQEALDRVVEDLQSECLVYTNDATQRLVCL